MIYSIQTGVVEEQFAISNINIYYEDCQNGNPYNTTFNVNVVSGYFSGFSQFTYDVKEFMRFIHEIKELYEFTREIVELRDICYGSIVRFETDKYGHVNISGTIFDKEYAMTQSLTFEFNTDQTAIRTFCNDLYGDFITENNTTN